jgi:hypothetical protein
MKKCKIDNDCISFESENEFLEAFMTLNEGKSLDDNTIVEGNSSLKFSKIKDFVEIFGLENVYFINSFKHGFIDEIYIDISKIKENTKKIWFNADELCFKNGFLRLWWD